MFTTQAEIREAFREHFQQVFQTSHPSNSDTLRETQGVANKLLVAMKTTLAENYTREEVVAALKQMALVKSLSIDGFNPIFYQIYWHIIEGEITSIVLKFLKFFDNCIKFTYIALISKISNLILASDFRPISLCNVMYELVSKFLANRLKKKSLWYHF